MQFDFQNPATVIMEGIVDFHHDIQFYLIVIVILVFWMLVSITYEYGIALNFGGYNQNYLDILKRRKDSLLLKQVTHGTVLEIIWTILPVFVLIFIAIPSFALLYAIDELIEPTLTIKVIGHQWYWSYEYSDYIEGDICFDSYMLADEDINMNQYRLLEVDRKLWLPTYTHVRVLVTSTDVLHSWAVPSFGVKMDACPGRLNQVSLFIKREGNFYGQCSELCGVNHGFMPIGIKSVEIPLFNYWVKFNLTN